MNELIKLTTERNIDVEKWANAKAILRPYTAGTIYLPNGESYKYPNGVNLIILGNDVMSTCERPWSEGTVALAFNEMLEKRGKGPFSVLELGFGLGIAARKTMKYLNLYGGSYDVIELNHDISERARSWGDAQNRSRTISRDNLPVSPNKAVGVRIYEGDAQRAIAKRAKLIREGRVSRVDIIIADTFPVSKSEEGKGIHDLQYLDSLSECLSDDGILLYYPFFPGSSGGITSEQEHLIRNNFGDFRSLRIPNKSLPEPLNPPPSYKYWWDEKNYPIRSISIGILQNPFRNNNNMLITDK